MPRHQTTLLVVFPVPLLVYFAAIGKLHYLLSIDSVIISNINSGNVHASVDRGTQPPSTDAVPSSWPPLDEFVDQDGNVTSRARRLLDWSVIGFGKCGTTAFLDWLDLHPQTRCIKSEVWDLVLGHPEGLIQKLHGLPAGERYSRGYKSPREIVDSRVLRYYRTYFPSAKLIVGIRHPVRWFESLYNFRVQNQKVKDAGRMRHPNDLVGVCTRGMKNTCTEKGNFALHLLRLGKQNHNSTSSPSSGGGSVPSERAERVLRLYRSKWYNASAVPAMPNPVFLFDVAQLGDSNATRSRQFQRDVQWFLGLEEEMLPFVRTKPGKVWGPVVQAKKDRLRIDICDDEYALVRANLVKMSRLNADWIRNEFLNYPGVHFSSRDFLEQILDTWMLDPCENGGGSAA
jgi:hypothetical protein